jgi:hypothetical protein
MSSSATRWPAPGGIAQIRADEHEAIELKQVEDPADPPVPPRNHPHPQAEAVALGNQALEPFERPRQQGIGFAKIDNYNAPPLLNRPLDRFGRRG